MKKSELLVIKEYYRELKVARDFYLEEIKKYSICDISEEALRDKKSLTSLTHDMNVISDLAYRLGIDL